jgi:hypothetical protein
MQAVEGLSKQAGKHQACLALGVPRCCLYPREKRQSPRALSPRALVIDRANMYQL